MASNRGQWSSKIGFILAAAGSAVGLGNVWRFPYIAQDNGGGIFVLLYLITVLFIGLPIMLLEFSIGRRAQSNPVGAFKKLAGGNWIWLGYLFVLTGISILSYYAVVAGWTVGYLVKSATGDLDPSAFGSYIADPVSQIGYLVVFLLLTAGIVFGGIQKGIEKASVILMPMLLLLMLLIIVRVMFLPTAIEGLEFYLVPDFEKLRPLTFIAVVGQAFFSLSLGMGAMLTYGSYQSKNDNLVTSALSVVLCDTLIATLAGFMIFPATGGSLEKGGPTLVFVTLIEVFNSMPGGRFVAIVFFILLAIAALTSTISLLEVAVAHLIDDRGWKRSTAVWAVTAICIILGIPSALSLGANEWLSSIFGKGFLGTMDFVFGNIALIFGGLMLCIFGAYKFGLSKLISEVEKGFPRFTTGFLVLIWTVVVRFIAPLLLATLLVFLLVTGEGF